MRLRTVQIYNYKSFADSGPIALNPHISFVTGPNNCGKTALLGALTLAAPAVPHRTTTTVPHSWDRPEPNSQVDLAFEVEQGELASLLANGMVDKFTLPAPQGSADPAALLQKVMAQERLLVACTWTFGPEGKGLATPTGVVP